MTIQAQLVMIAWLPIVFYLFTRFKTQEAVIISFIAAWLLLPQRAEFSFPGLPDYERMSATVYSISLATIIYDFERINKFSPSWIDIPMLVWCICPLFSSLSNGLGIYDGVSESLINTVAYGGPYFIGRIYLNSLTGMRQLAIAIFIGGLAYIPLCLYEIRFSPQLHRMVYGYHPNSFGQTVRYGGFRPTVFMEHGLAVGMWMMAATLIGIWLWKTNVIKQLFGISMLWLVAMLFATFILVKSTGAYGLLFAGTIILLIAWQFRTSVTLLLVVLFTIFYLQQNVSANANLTEQVVTTLNSYGLPEDRIQSLQFRFDNEELLADKARERIVFGWGGWGRNRVYDYNWRGELVDVSITDSLWIIAFGVNGLVGLISLYGSVFIPVVAFVLSYPAENWSNYKVGPAAAIVVVLTLYMVDCTLNNQVNPVFTLATGGISGLIVQNKDI
ncbi:hypothetical protein NIES4102_01230 [Chondrocystis sp. NIES-4102]|nr:hypothetical protein NIES4102_01230 [Chondrocystis sp. NIES-4102]